MLKLYIIMEYERVTTGIPGLDKLLYGGIPKGHVVLISGVAGAGKTTFLSQFCWEGLQKGEKALFITLEESPEEIKGDMLQYGWDFEQYEKKGMFRIEYFDPFELSDMSHRLRDLIEVNKYDRVVIDSLSLLGMYIKDEYEIRKKLFKIVQALKKSKATSLLSAEIPEHEPKKLSRYGVEEFVVDGVIVLYYLNMAGESFGNIEVRKMRRTKHAHGAFPTIITKNGYYVSIENLDGDILR